MKTPLSLATRIGLSFTAILALLVVITAIGSQRVAFIDSTLSDVSQNAAKVQRYAINFRGSVHSRQVASASTELAQLAERLADKVAFFGAAYP
ncbi:hypothetical protein PCPL58_3684 [Pseudomonas cerasi]|uniref:Methyl-accepting chemotaxis protein n=1 Tax=Pseudomonas cerasi TaxID=1583341 RepID=A0A193SSY4_9PSED|nr:hypothetical protein PCPL58_3684 [Pseudomonas cerasi]SOS21861.1 hypothetical protein PL963_03774 [Pseudomonas cerasi]